MRKILIVGGGQAGLQLGLTLLRHTYDVTLMTARTADEVRNGRATSNQIQFPSSLQYEHEYGLNFTDTVPEYVTTWQNRFAGGAGVPGYQWSGRFSREPGALCVDERLKMSEWQRMFEERGGRVIIHPVTSSDLDAMTRMFDLVVVAAGHSGLAEMFPANPTHELSNVSANGVMLAYVRVDEDTGTGLGEVHMLPEVGYFVVMPAISVTGPCKLIYLCGPATGPLGSWPDRIRPTEHLALILRTLQEHDVEQYERFRDAELADPRAVAVDYSQPVVRHPVATLPSGGKVMGLGDTVLVTQPNMAQEVNNAYKSAEITLTNILEHGDRPFDEEFMLRCFDQFWCYARHMAGTVGTALSAPSPALMELLGAAATHQEIADRFVDGFDDPADYDAWVTSEEKARDYLERVTGVRTLQPG
ncbi:styrene monooxygenase/indole monooxygenase family protein [Halostreptopolyspora alba]|uniref:FAD-binding oxidoreductase n=1 Tax=Halostreptopolyspora alba TaxID=2487137 RepID=A0A3N0EE13_9ACTN|nr:FAD-binding oxidoreductase [Nocardiopsaceae bacterium YIM 96095]